MFGGRLPPASVSPSVIVAPCPAGWTQGAHTERQVQRGLWRPISHCPGPLSPLTLQQATCAPARASHFL